MKKFKNLCLVDTIYSLLLYMLYCKDDIFEDTFYVFGNCMPNNMDNVFPHYYRMIIPDSYSYISYDDWKFYRNQVKKNIPSADNYYCQDHLCFSPSVIHYHHYTLLEDSPLICKKYYNGPRRREFESKKNTIKQLIKRLVYGPVYKFPLATNSLCNSIIVTKYDDSFFLHKKKQIVCDLVDLWNSIGEMKQKEILSVFNLNQDDVEILRSKKQILFTQPLAELLSEKESIDVYQRMIKKYNSKDTLIKVHPRDKIDYSTFFPEYTIFDKIVPSELLSFLSIRYKKAITAYSASVYGFDYPIEIDWYGSAVNDKLLRIVGEFSAPEGANVCSL